MRNFFKKFDFGDSAKFVLDLFLNFVVIVVLALLIRTYLVSPFHVFGPSMCDTLNYINDECADSYGEYIIVNEVGYQNFFGKTLSEPKSGDIIIFKPPGDDKGQFFVKRVIGLPGDKIKISDGIVYKWEDGGFEELDESAYLNENNLGRTLMPGNDSRTFDVPEDVYLVLGDNRARSTDSRHCFGKTSVAACTGSNESAYVQRGDIRGKAWVVFWPLNKLRALH